MQLLDSRPVLLHTRLLGVRGAEIVRSRRHNGRLYQVRRSAQATAAFALVAMFWITTARSGDWEDCIQQSDPQTSIEGCTKLIVTDQYTGSNLAIMYSFRGLAYSENEEIESAKADLDVAVQLDPTQPDAYARRGWIFARAGNHRHAIADYTKSLELYSRDAEVYLNRGAAYHSLGEFVEALNDYERAVQLDPKLPGAYIGRGAILLEQKGEYNLAIANFDRAIDLDPTVAASFISRGYAHQLKSDFQRAMADYNQAIQIDPSSAVGLSRRGWLHQEAGNSEAALSDYRRAASLFPPWQKALLVQIAAVEARLRATPPANVHAPEPMTTDQNPFAPTVHKNLPGWNPPEVAFPSPNPGPELDARVVYRQVAPSVYLVLATPSLDLEEDEPFSQDRRLRSPITWPLQTAMWSKASAT